MIIYSRIPTLSQFQKDSSVTFAFRKSDPVLSRIDVLVDAYHESKHPNTVICDLYYALDYWVRYVKSNRGMEKGRTHAIEGLHRCVTCHLCYLFNCGPGDVRRELDQTFGGEMSMIGMDTDFRDGKARYFTRQQLERHRIWFKGGLAYQSGAWGSKGKRPERRLVDSSNLYNPMAVFDKDKVSHVANVNYGPFILTPGREFYMSYHRPGEGNQHNGLYHSSYLAGETVMAAGSMLIERGRVKRIRSDSGHYKPTDTNMLAVLQALKMFAVPSITLSWRITSAPGRSRPGNLPRQVQIGIC